MPSLLPEREVALVNEETVVTRIVTMLVVVSALVATVVSAQDTVEIEGVKYGTRHILKELIDVKPVHPDFEFCPTYCYTDVVQHSVIECRVANGPIGEPPYIDNRGELTGNVPRWTITETHDIREIAVSESRCNRTETHTVVEVLGRVPRYYPGDTNIEDKRTRQELGLAPFDCNDHPATVDQATGDLVARVEIDLLIERRQRFCR